MHLCSTRQVVVRVMEIIDSITFVFVDEQPKCRSGEHVDERDDERWRQQCDREHGGSGARGWSPGHPNRDFFVQLLGVGLAVGRIRDHALAIAR
jgi:hypothetical protein